MTFAGRLISFFSAFILSLALATILWFGAHPTLWQPLILLFILYLLPPLAFRLHHLICPIKKSLSNLSDLRYSPWWGAHQIQLLYFAVPQLEALLRITPGAYSAWLRLWGSRIGKQVYWTPNLEITDRHLLDLGDRVLLGHRCKLLGHAIKPKGEAMMLFTRTIKIGNDVFVGAGSRIGPGAVVADGSYLPALTDIHINQAFDS